MLILRFFGFGNGYEFSKLIWRNYGSIEIKDLIWFKYAIFEMYYHVISKFNGIIKLY